MWQVFIALLVGGGPPAAVAAKNQIKAALKKEVKRTFLGEPKKSDPKPRKNLGFGIYWQ